MGGGKLLLLNMFGIDEALIWVSWFVFLYIWAMIVMPFFGRLIDRKPYLWTIAIAGLSYLGQVAVWYFVRDFNSRTWWHALNVCLMWTPVIVLGYLFARKELFQKIRIPNHWLVPIVASVVVVAALWMKMVMPGIKILNFDIIYAPVIILCILVVFSQYKMKWLSKVMSELGDKSVYMWFIHALFFTAATRPVYHHFVMISNNLWIVAIWTIVLSYIISVVLKKIIEY